jgi:hypothetical protein
MLTFALKTISYWHLPFRRYVYETPRALRSSRSVSEAKTSPFVSLWYCSMGGTPPARGLATAQQAWRRLETTGRAPEGLVFAASALKLPQTALDAWDPRRKRPRKKQRDAKRRQQQEAEPSSAKRPRGNS